MSLKKVFTVNHKSLKRQNSELTVSICNTWFTTTDTHFRNYEQGDLSAQEITLRDSSIKYFTD